MSLTVDIQRKLRGFALHAQFTHSGGTLGILGASGCGKTMTLQCIAGIVTPTSGRIELNGRVLYDSAKRINLKPQKRKVGYLFQNYALFPNMTVEGNIACALGSLSKGEKTRRTAALLGQFRLDGMEKRYPAQLSGGQQQRVALARILAYEPELLLLDEPFSALDTYLKEQLQLELLEMLEGYPGDIILVTHSRDEVYKLSQRLMIMDGGLTLGEAETKQMFETPETLMAARLTGCKNLSPVTKAGPTSVYAKAWGVTFEVGREVGEHITHIGIRAHEFRAATPGDGQANCIPVHILKQWEAPFEWNVMFRHSGASESEGELWWKCDKVSYPSSPPAYLSVQPSGILLLHE